MAPEAQLEWEARAARPAALAAFASAVLGVVAFVVFAATIGATPTDSVERLIKEDHHATAYLVAAILQGLSVAPLAITLSFLYRASAFRRPETPAIARHLSRVAPLAFAVLTIASAVQELHVADQVLKDLPLPPHLAHERVNHEQTTGAAVIIGSLGLAARLAVAFGVSLVAINARRAGLLSNFMGILGVIVGILFVIPLGPLPVIQWFWLGALGLILLDRWPSGRGPAWESGEADPWPSQAELRAEARGEAPDRGREEPEEDGPDARAGGQEDEYDEPEAEPGAPAHPRSKKRKRKRRR